jgi:hypothetical protein
MRRFMMTFGGTVVVLGSSMIASGQDKIQAPAQAPPKAVQAPVQAPMKQAPAPVQAPAKVAPVQAPTQKPMQAPMQAPTQKHVQAPTQKGMMGPPPPKTARVRLFNRYG